MSESEEEKGPWGGELKSKGRAGVCSFTHWAIHFILLHSEIEYNNLLWTGRVSFDIDIDDTSDVQWPLNKGPTGVTEERNEEVANLFFPYLLSH